MSLKPLLLGGDRRSIGHSGEVVGLVLAQPELFDELIHYIIDEDPLVRMRAADAVEKLTAEHSDWLEPYVPLLLEAGEINQKEVRWHVAQLLPRVRLASAQKQQATKMFREWHADPKNGNIVRVFALQALVDMNAADVPELIAVILDDPHAPPSLQARARKLQKMIA